MADASDKDDSVKRASTDAHKQHLSASIETFKPIFSFAVEGLKTLQLAHGGGLTAVLAFAGVRLNANASKALPPEIGFAVLTFGSGLGSTLLVWFLAWLSQMYYTRSVNLCRFDHEYPFVHETETSKIAEEIGDRLRLFGVIMAILSFFTFVVGLYFVYRSVAA
jgi:hypothetical protein